MDTDLKVKISTGSIGPAHDPYGFTRVTLRTGTRCATLYTDGLGRNRATFTDDDQVLREEEWFDGPQAATQRLKVDLRCKRFVGVSFSTAEDEHYRTEQFA